MTFRLPTQQIFHYMVHRKRKIEPDEPVAPLIMAFENEPRLERDAEPENQSVMLGLLTPKMTRNLFKPGSSPQDINL